MDTEEVNKINQRIEIFDEIREVLHERQEALGECNANQFEWVANMSIGLGRISELTYMTLAGDAHPIEVREAAIELAGVVIEFIECYDRVMSRAMDDK